MFNSRFSVKQGLLGAFAVCLSLLFFTGCEQLPDGRIKIEFEIQLPKTSTGDLSKVETYSYKKNIYVIEGSSGAELILFAAEEDSKLWVNYTSYDSGIVITGIAYDADGDCVAPNWTAGIIDAEDYGIANIVTSETANSSEGSSWTYYVKDVKEGEDASDAQFVKSELGCSSRSLKKYSADQWKYESYSFTW